MKIEKEIEKDGIKIKGQWEPGMSLGLYGIDAEAEIMKILNEEMARELKKWDKKIPTVTGKIRKIKV